MKTCGIFDVHQVDIQLSSARETWRLCPFGDVHRDAEGHALDRWLEDLSRWKSHRNTLFLGMGDYFDFLSTSERAVVDAKNLHESSMSKLERQSKREVEDFAKEISFMTARSNHLVGLLGGNHFYAYADGSTSDTQLAGLLHTKFLGVSCFVRLSFHWPGSNKTASIDVFAHHGAGGGGRLIGGSLNRVSQLAEYADCDIALMGHDHKRGVVPLPPMLMLSRNRHGDLHVKERQRWVGRTGSYLMAYMPGKASYNVDAARGPASLGSIEFELTPTRSRRKGDELEIAIRGVA